MVKEVVSPCFLGVAVCHFTMKLNNRCASNQMWASGSCSTRRFRKSCEANFAGSVEVAIDETTNAEYIGRTTMFPRTQDTYFLTEYKNVEHH